MKLFNYKNNTIGKEELVLTNEEELEAELFSMRENAKTAKEKEGKSQEGDVVNIDFEGFVDGVAFEGGKGENYDLELGSGTFIPGFETQLIGYEKGAEVDVNVTFPENYQAENLKGKPALFKCKINAVKEKITPELDDAFAQMYGIPTLDNLKEVLKAQMDSKKREDAINEYLGKLINMIIEKSEIEVNDEEKESRINEMLQYYEQAMKSYGTDLDNFLKMTNQDLDTFKNTQIVPEAIKTLQMDNLIKEIAKLENIVATDEDIEKDLQAIKVQYQMLDDQFEQFKELRKNEIAFEVLRRKVSLFLYENNN